jgi:hypothetical protein
MLRKPSITEIIAISKIVAISRFKAFCPLFCNERSADNVVE